MQHVGCAGHDEGACLVPERMAMTEMQIEHLQPNVALVVVALWRIGSLVVTTIYVERAETPH